MKSIRLSLITYFLALVALALGAASLLAYQIARATLLERKAASRDFLEAQYRENVQAVKEKVDEELRRQAGTVAKLARYQFDWDRARLQGLFVLTLLTAAPETNPHVTWPLCFAQGRPFGRYPWLLQQLVVTEIQFPEEELPAPDSSGPPVTYFQLSNEWGNVWRSASLEGHTFAHDQEVFRRTPLYIPQFQNLEIKPGVWGRRLMVKVPVSGVREQWQWRPGSRWPLPGSSGSSRSSRTGLPQEGSQRGFRPQPSPTEMVERESLTRVLLVQCATDDTWQKERIAELGAELEEALLVRDIAMDDHLASLRNRLLLISLATFAATMAGGFWLVQLGLLPLQRLSEAVSRVSERDFRLQIDEPHLPVELRPIAQRLTHTLDQLKRAFAREKQAAADISHDLRTPLAALLTTTEVALRKPRSPSEYREILAECRASGQHMNHLVERLLALARLDAGVDQLRPRQFDAANLAEQCVGMVRPLAEARGLDLRLHTKGPAVLRNDPDKLREVLTNLLHNAIEYNRPDGSVDVTVERHNGSLHLEVRDTGIGIAPDAREHIFERFFRVDPARQSDGQHSGLGLAIVKGYLDLMGGTIQVESELDAGSAFRIELPAH